MHWFQHLPLKKNLLNMSHQHHKFRWFLHVLFVIFIFLDPTSPIPTTSHQGCVLFRSYSPLSNRTSFHTLTVLFGEGTASSQPPHCHPESSPCLLRTAPPDQDRPQGLPRPPGPSRDRPHRPAEGRTPQPAPRRPSTHPRPAARCTRRWRRWGEYRQTWCSWWSQHPPPVTPPRSRK